MSVRSTPMGGRRTTIVESTKVYRDLDPIWLSSRINNEVGYKMKSMDIPRPRRPSHWIVVLIFLAGALAWLLHPLPVPEVIYSPEEYKPRAESRDLDLTPQRQVTLAALPLARACEEQDVVLGRDFVVNGERLHAHVLHMCGGETILGARVEFEGTDRIICQETYGGQARTIERLSRGSLSGTSARTLEPISMRLTGRPLCAAAHGVDVNDGIW